jgi:hypothetical protein
LTASATGLVGTDTLASLALGYTLSTTATTTSGVASYPITFTGGATSTGNYGPITYTPGALTVTKATPVITWNNPADITSGTALSATQLNATVAGGLAGGFVYTPGAGTVLPAGAGQSLSVTFTPTDTANYTNATRAVVINVTNGQAASTTNTPTSSLNPSTFGQAVIFTTTVSGAGGPPAGTVTFYDGAAALGTATLSGGTASLTTTTASAGTRSITAVYNGNSQFAASTSPALTQTVNKATATATFTLSPLSRQYSDRETYDVTLSPASLGGSAPATSVTFKFGATVIGTVSMVLDTQTGNLRGTLSNVPVTQAPGNRIVTTAFGGVSNNFTVTNPTKVLIVNQEDARAAYNGATAVQTACHTCSTATINLSALIKDISSTVDAAGDTDSGDIRNANVMFVDRSTGAIIGTVSVALTGSDITVGQATFNWNVDIGAATSKSYTIGMIVSNYYARNSTTENAVVVVSKP